MERNKCGVLGLVNFAQKQGWVKIEGGGDGGEGGLEGDLIVK